MVERRWAMGDGDALALAAGKLGHAAPHLGIKSTNCDLAG
jgi:hypothetical protein